MIKIMKLIKCLRNLERAIKSLESIKKMSELFGVSVQEISSIQDVNHTADVIKQFVNKLKISVISKKFSLSLFKYSNFNYTFASLILVIVFCSRNFHLREYDTTKS